MRRRDPIYAEISGKMRRQISIGLAMPTVKESTYRFCSYRPCMHFADHPLPPSLEDE